MTATSSAVGAPVLVIGGGISGLTAALEASEAGHEVYLVERNTYLGGRVVQMNKYFPKMCPPTCGVEIFLKRLRTTERVHLLTDSEVAAVSGNPGAFTVTVKTRPRGVNANCTNCGACVAVCPRERPDAYNYGLSKTKAIHLPFGAAYPPRYAIDFAHCDGKSCAKCVAACQYAAIDLDEKERTKTLTVGAIVVATGWKPYDAKKLEHLAYGQAKNVVTNVEFERLVAADGPTGGKILRPSDGQPPKSVAFVHCAGSRDELHLPHCSAVCCMASFKQARYVLDQLPEAKVAHFYIDRRAPGRLEDFLQALEAEPRATLTKGKVAKITEDASGGLILEAEDTLLGKKLGFTADLAVLAVGLVPESATANFPSSWPAEPTGFLGASPGVFPAGCAKRPGDVATAARDGAAAALKAAFCGKVR
ncbi:MAG: FAD-dependent oxidoreductase [Planctomycetes bacterium]|jgi:quinone-modifying oxidoreductase subunit QmoA|nr:FAD-dependent oxidoreductase [Planctomycetota bacterium]